MISNISSGKLDNLQSPGHHVLPKSPFSGNAGIVGEVSI